MQRFVIALTLYGGCTDLPKQGPQRLDPFGMAGVGALASAFGWIGHGKSPARKNAQETKGVVDGWPATLPRNLARETEKNQRHMRRTGKTGEHSQEYALIRDRHTNKWHAASASSCTCPLWHRPHTALMPIQINQLSAYSNH
ncbi:hypothetical protein [Corticibacter populi]|uniref:hypothetical protein n=1 Tax=Corticibacter populi TaxID=1550736 RepID=UPI00102C7791|nr:hypothetical protein [Corticibacter populi]